LNSDNIKVKEFIIDENIIDICSGDWFSVLLTQSGKVYEFFVSEDIEEIYFKLNNFTNNEKVNEFFVWEDLKEIYLRLNNFTNNGKENEKIVMISCGNEHSLALTESGHVFGWGDNYLAQLGVINVEHSSEPIIIELNDLKIKKISCGAYYSLLLSCDGDIYAFGSNRGGEIGNGTQEEQRLPNFSKSVLILT
jgi:alpha-tubulin suppressor-like RCC1 family protein